MGVMRGQLIKEDNIGGMIGHPRSEIIKDNSKYIGNRKLLLADKSDICVYITYLYHKYIYMYSKLY